MASVSLSPSLRIPSAPSFAIVAAQPCRTASILSSQAIMASFSLSFIANNALATTAGRPVLELKITDLVTETSRDMVQESLDTARAGKRVPPADVVFGEGQNARFHPRLPIRQ